MNRLWIALPVSAICFFIFGLFLYYFGIDMNGLLTSLAMFFFGGGWSSLGWGVMPYINNKTKPHSVLQRDVKGPTPHSDLQHTLDLVEVEKPSKFVEAVAAASIFFVAAISFYMVKLFVTNPVQTTIDLIEITFFVIVAIIAGSLAVLALRKR